MAYQTYKEIINKLKKLKSEKGKLLEVGSGQGGFLKVCQTGGWNVYGVDISDECVNYTKSENEIKNIFSGDLIGAGFEENQFDVVIMNHLIEHLTEPLKYLYLNEINRILKPSGLISISTPNIDSLSVKVFRRYWQALFVPLHLTLFSHDTLSHMLQKTGYSLSKVSHYSLVTNAYDLLRSISCILGIFVLKLKKLLKGEDNEVEYSLKVKCIKESRGRVIFRLLKPILNFFVFPTVFLRGLSNVVQVLPSMHLPINQITNLKKYFLQSQKQIYYHFLTKITCLL
ncbi:MAG: class I SAM-dependent methyltransferase [Anaerolineaceae bacterium]